MTIALYGRAPKLGDDLRQLISPSGDQARFSFEFSAHGRSYRIMRVLHRTRPTTVAFELRGDDGEWGTLTRGVREANAKVEEVLGLDFDSFTKVVLLPQNEFDAFLRGKPEERRSILTRLLSLEIYGAIQQRANLVATDANAQAEVLTGLLERDYADATPERLAEVRDARAAAEAAVETLTGRLSSLERAVAVAFETRQRRLAHGQANEDLADLQRRLGVARDEHDTATGALAVADRDLTTIAERLASISYDADRHLLLARAAEQATRLGQVIAALARVDRDDAAGRARLEDLVRRRDTLLNAVRDSEGILAQALAAEGSAQADLDEQRRRFGTRATIAGLMERERQCREDRRHEREVDRTLETLNARQAELTGSLDELRSRHAEASEHLEHAERVREERERAFEACRAIKTQAQTVGQSLAQGRARATRAQTALEQARADADRKRAVLVEAGQARQAAQDIVDASEKELAQLQQLHAAHTLRGILAIGQPCPVCARKVTKVPGGEPLEDVDRVRRAAVNGRARLTKVQAQEQRAALEVAASDETLRATTSTWEELRSELERGGAELRRVLPTELQDDARWLETLQARTDAAAAGRDAAERDVGAARGLVAGVAGQIAGTEGELRTLPVQIEERREMLRSIRERCEETEQVVSVLLGRPPGPDAATELAAIDIRLRTAEESLASATVSVQQARDRQQQAQAAVADAQREADTEAERSRARMQERAQLTGEREEVQRALEAIVPGRADVGQAVAAELGALADARAQRAEVSGELEAGRRARDDTARRVTELAGRVGALDRQLEDQRQRQRAAKDALDVILAELSVRLAETAVTLAPGGGDEHAQLSGLVQRTQGDRDAAVRRAGELGSGEEGLIERIARAAECRQQLGAARRRAEVARELAYLLGANNLQTYLVRDAMRVLVEDGSLHLQRLSDGRYTLQADDLDFQVVDRWNGDAVRSVKTLSGGETFLTSLALALALAERLADLAAGAHGHEALESLFVDEGFGALDTEETLETVVQAIEALQAHDRVVGIVTHLTPLADRMPAQIKVRKAPEGSTVEMVK